MAYMIIIVDITDIIAIANTNTSIIKLLVKKFLLANSVFNSSISCLSFKSNIYLSRLYWAIYSFNVSGADSNISSNVLSIRKMGRFISNVDLLVSMGTSYSSIKLNSFKYIVKALLTVKNIISLELES